MKKSFEHFITFFLSLLLGHFFLSCNNDVCKLPDGYITSDLLESVAMSKGYHYCNLLDASLNGSNDSIRKLALLDFSDAVGYDHGAVLIEVIHKVGNRKFINAITEISTAEKHKIEGYLNVGLMYGYRKEYENSRLEEVFPSIDSFLNSN